MVRIAIAVMFLLAGTAVLRGQSRASDLQVAELSINIYGDKPKTVKRRTEAEQPRPAETQLGKIAGELLKKRCTADQNQAARYADLFFFRNVTGLGLSAAQEAQLIAAIMAQDGAGAMEFTATLRQDPNVQTRLVANLVALYVWGRTGKELADKQAQELFAALEKDKASEYRMLKADYSYLRALSAWSAGDNTRALKDLDDAVGVEPEFFNAHVIRVAILIDLAARAMVRDDDACLSAFDKLAEALGAIMQFSPCALQGAHLARYLRSQQAEPDRHVPLLLTEMFLSTVSQHRAAFENKTTKLDDLIDKRSQCGRNISDSIVQLNTLFVKPDLAAGHK
jgi:hypothetical protein